MPYTGTPARKKRLRKGRGFVGKETNYPGSRARTVASNAPSIVAADQMGSCFTIAPDQTVESCTEDFLHLPRVAAVGWLSQ